MANWSLGGGGLQRGLHRQLYSSCIHAKTTQIENLMCDFLIFFFLITEKKFIAAQIPPKSLLLNNAAKHLYLI